MVGMAAVEPVGHAVDLILRDDVREIDMGVVDGDAKVQHGIDTSPVAESNGHAVGILCVEALDIIVVLLHVGTEFLLIGIVFHRNGIERGLQVAGYVSVEVFPKRAWAAVVAVEPRPTGNLGGLSGLGGAITCAGEPVVVGFGLCVAGEPRVAGG